MHQQKTLTLNAKPNLSYLTLYLDWLVIWSRIRDRVADMTMITTAFLLAAVIIDVIRLHSAMITATVIAADCSRMTSMITLTLTQALLKESQLFSVCNWSPRSTQPSIPLGR